MTYMGLSENVVYPKKPNGFDDGFADHYPYFLWIFFWGIPHFQTYPYDLIIKFLPNHLQMHILRVPERRSQQVC